jgi:hypothetical protein
MKRELCFDGTEERTAQKFSEIMAGLKYLAEAMAVLEVFEKLLVAFIDKITLTKEGDYVHLCESLLPNPPPNAKFVSFFNFFFVAAGDERFQGVSIAQLDFREKSLVWCIPLGLAAGREQQFRQFKTQISEIFRGCGFRILNQGGE